MSGRSLSGIVLVVVSFAGCGQDNAALNDSIAFDTQQHIAAWVAAWNLRDLTAVDHLFLNDTTATYFSSEREGLIRGYSNIREHHERFGFVPGGGAPADELWVDDLQTSAHGKTAVIAGLWYFGDKAADPGDIQRGPMTVVYVLDGNRWKITHMHFGEYAEP